MSKAAQQRTGQRLAVAVVDAARDQIEERSVGGRGGVCAGARARRTGTRARASNRCVAAAVDRDPGARRKAASARAADPAPGPPARRRPASGRRRSACRSRASSPGNTRSGVAGPARRRQHAVEIGEPRGGEQAAARRGRPDERLDRPLRRARQRQAADAGDHQPEPQRLDAQQPPGGAGDRRAAKWPLPCNRTPGTTAAATGAPHAGEGQARRRRWQASCRPRRSSTGRNQQ